MIDFHVTVFDDVFFSFLKSDLCRIGRYINDNVLTFQFTSLIVGTLLAAFMGTWGAQAIAERNKRKEDLLKEIRNTNAAIMTSHSIWNVMYVLRKDHVQFLRDIFYCDRDKVNSHIQNRNLGKTNKIYEFLGDYRDLSLAKMPTDILQNKIFDSLSITGRPLALATTLSQVIHCLKRAFKKRNKLIASQKGTSSPEERAKLYFGLIIDGKSLDRTYPDIIEAIYNYIDNAQFFTQLLCEDLILHGEVLTKKFKEDFGDTPPTISRPEFNDADPALMPDKKLYSDWLTKFVKANVRPNRLQQFLRFLRKSVSA